MSKVYVQRDELNKVSVIYTINYRHLDLEELDSTDPEVFEIINPEENYINKRNKERGSLTSQWEFFLDNGYEAAKAKDDNIKRKYPKP